MVKVILIKIKQDRRIESASSGEQRWVERVSREMKKGVTEKAMFE